MTGLRRPVRACDLSVADATPSCSTGPLGRLGWTIREVAALLRRPGRGRRAR